MSEPSDAGTARAATVAAEPPLEPPGACASDQGFAVGPKAEFSVEEPIANSSQLVLPTMTAPAAASRSTTVALYGGTKPDRIFEPAVVGTPFVQMLSLTAIGTPASGPRASPRARAASTAAACARACSAATAVKAASDGS